MKILLNISLLLIPVFGFSQKLPEIDALNRVILNHKDSIIYAYLLPTDKGKKVTASDKYWYNWYAQHDIKETRGGFDGKLLHGEYIEFYENKNLKKKGIFKKGLKTGKWKSWYMNGQISEIVYYKNGLRKGRDLVFNSSGEQISKSKYRKGELVKLKVNKKIKNDTSIVQDNKNKKVKSKDRKGKDSIDSTKGKKEEINKEKKNKKEPKIRVRRGIKIFSQPGKST